MLYLSPCQSKMCLTSTFALPEFKDISEYFLMFFVQIIFSLITLIDDKKSRYTFFRNKRFVFDEILQRNFACHIFWNLNT